jgi:hypothetical protein
LIVVVQVGTIALAAYLTTGLYRPLAARHAKTLNPD